ncbi:NAD(P)-dependent alcohol dehydrogenase [Neisseriaceae bacterium TC5R-5]|nr:NAD(P)-dependent alcohol dehydrogenase [Neisseriaceae bacterium TC5R-5]
MTNTPTTSNKQDNLIQAWAAQASGAALTPFQFDAGPLGNEEVEIAVAYCGICHSDLSMLDNEWGMTNYPFVPGHEAVGRIVRLGSQATNKGLQLGQTVGIGWHSTSCMHCHPCLSGDHNLCGQAQPTIVGRHGGFADKLRCHWAWAIPLPEQLDISSAGPLFCGGITVFNPLLQHKILPTQRVGVVGIGGLGHLALRFMRAWGCEVTAFTSSSSKHAEAMALGAHRVVASNDSAALRSLAGQLDFVLVTANVALDWNAFIQTLAPKGRLHFVGAIPKPLGLAVFPLLLQQASVSGSPTGSPASIGEMLAFCARHQIAPQVEHFALSEVNAALDHLRAGKARYRLILDMQK